MATTQARTRTMTEYGSYNFKTKDPVIDVLRSLVQLEANVRSVSFDRAMKDVAESSGVSYGCLCGWFYGATVSPRFAFVQRVAHACGCEFAPHAISAKKRFDRAH